MDIPRLTSDVQALLSAQANDDNAAQMAAYMKTDMPFYGVRAAGVKAVVRSIKNSNAPATPAEYNQSVLALWRLPHREEKHIAILWARAFPEFITMRSVDLYRRLVVEGAWWDLVDENATHLIGRVLLGSRVECTPVVRAWIGHDDLWLRRTSIIAQLLHKAATDVSLLEDACISNFKDRDFFIRKAIGWALRQHARTDPEWVRGFVATYRKEMAPLSVREATKHLPTED